MDVLLVDPSLFTAPYDSALSGGLISNAVRPRWATRKLRAGEEPVIDPSMHDVIFYPWTDGRNRRTGVTARMVKGVEHVAALRQLARKARTFDLVHFQWALLPQFDLQAVRSIRRFCPVVLTIHDTVPYNGKAVSQMQTTGLAALYAEADRLIVHSEVAADALLAAGVAARKIVVVPHGLLPLESQSSCVRKDDRWRVVQFGKIQHYKGVDILVEALGLLDANGRGALRVIVAGEPQIDMAPLAARAEALGLVDTLEFRAHFHSKAEMADLLSHADAFVFPYRAIEASGVLFLVAATGKWLIASNLGSLSQTIGHDGGAGVLVTPGDARALAKALVASIGCRPTRSIATDVPGWAEIGRQTRAVYESAMADWSRIDTAGAA